MKKFSLIVSITVAIVALFFISCGNCTGSVVEAVDSDVYVSPANDEPVAAPVISTADTDEEDDDSDDLEEEDRIINDEMNALVKKLSYHLPDRIWNSMVLGDVSFLLEDEEIELEILNSFTIKNKLRNADQGELDQLGQAFVANFMAGYRAVINNNEVEGEPEVYRNLGPLLKATARYDFSIKFILTDSYEENFRFTIGPKYVERGVLMNEKDYY